MGDWTVLKFWGPGDGYHDWHSLQNTVHWRPSTAEVIQEYYCWPVVKEHASEPEVPAPSPEFDITLTHLGEEAKGITKHGRPGWRYLIAWKVPEGHPNAGKGRIETVYGFPTKDRAKAGAEYRADQIAEAYAHQLRYKYTPGGG